MGQIITTSGNVYESFVQIENRKNLMLHFVEKNGLTIYEKFSNYPRTTGQPINAKDKKRGGKMI